MAIMKMKMYENNNVNNENNEKSENNNVMKIMN